MNIIKKNDEKYLNKSNTLNNMKKQIYRNNKQLNVGKITNKSNININKNNKIKLNYETKINKENNYNKVNDLKREDNYSSRYSSRNEKNMKAKVKYQNMNTPIEYNKNVGTGYNNNASSRNQIYYSFITNNRVNNLYIYQETNKGIYKINPSIEDYN